VHTTACTAADALAELVREASRSSADASAHLRRALLAADAWVKTPDRLRRGGVVQPRSGLDPVDRAI
jgi:hypothetical protein